MQWWLQTRGRAIDYPQGILSPHGPHLPDWWAGWWHPFQDHTTPEEPMFLLEILPGQSWRLYLAAMDAGRRDNQGRTIRNSLLVAGDPDEKDALHLLLSGYLDPDHPLAHALQQTFPEDRVERWLSAQTRPSRHELPRLPSPEATARPLPHQERGVYAWLNLLSGAEEPVNIPHLRDLYFPDKGWVSRKGGPPEPPDPSPAGLHQTSSAASGLWQRILQLLASLFGKGSGVV